jgi:hypothetical protein
LKFLRIGQIVINLDHVTFVDLGEVDIDGEGDVLIYLSTDADGEPSLTIDDPGQKAALRAYFRPDRPGGEQFNGDRVGGLKVLGAGEASP